VTGGGGGIGAAIARRFHEEGAVLVVNDVDADRAARTAREVGGFAVAADVADSGAVARMFDAVRERHGRLDVLVNNAGIAGHESNPERAQRFTDLALTQLRERMSGGGIQTHNDATIELSDEDWHRMLAVHLDGTFFCTREALRLMNAQGNGAIVNMGSIMGTAGGAGVAAYAAAKAGILGFTRAVAREVATRGIRVNAIAPGWIETDMTAPLAPVRAMLEMQTPLGRMGTVDDVAWAAVYLASDEAAFLTGQVLSPNGGWTMNQ
jgi:3-oxoacyl-[acyl-carrier protein] reductase